jgi:hypothetical protein
MEWVVSLVILLAIYFVYKEKKNLRAHKALLESTGPEKVIFQYQSLRRRMFIVLALTGSLGAFVGTALKSEPQHPFQALSTTTLIILVLGTRRAVPFAMCPLEVATKNRVECFHKSYPPCRWPSQLYQNQLETT